MHIGDMTSLVRITNYQIGVGLGNKGNPVQSYSMEMAGHLLKFHYGRFKNHAGKFEDKFVHVQIEFSDSFETIVDNDKEYIGTISLHEDKDKEISNQIISINIRIKLPINVFQNLFITVRNIYILHFYHYF